MINSHTLSGGLGIMFVAVFLLRLTNVQAALDDDSGYPFLFIFKQSFSPVAAKSLGAIVIGLLFAGTVSYNLACLMLTYVVSIACLLYRRVHQPELLPEARWTLGRSGVAINIAALAYSTFALFWSFWPNFSHLSLVDFNWAIVMFLVTLLVAMVDWEFRAKYAYFGPVQKITVAADDERVHSS
jgi:hypothetical protein